jgi:type 1 fimbria pilin
MLMKKTLLAASLAATTLFTATSAFAVDSVELKVIGTISPVACTPTLSGGGSIDYGDMKASSLAQDDYTVLDEKTLDFSIACDGKAKVAMKVVNGRLDTLAGSTENALSGAGAVPTGVTLTTGDAAYGLGLAGSAKIGGYGIALSAPKADGTAVDSIYKSADASVTTWTKGATKSSLTTSTDELTLTSWATTGTLVPIALKALAGTLSVQAYINKASALDMTKPTKLDGLATLELVYL